MGATMLVYASMPRNPALSALRVTSRKHRIGAHTSAAGGVHRAAEEAVRIGCNALQVFTRSPRMWRGTAPRPDSIRRLDEIRRKHDLWPVAVHGCYLTNLAAADKTVHDKSRQSFRLEIENARAIGADFLVIHPGSARGQATSMAIEVFADAVADVQQGFDWGAMRLLLENTAGGGATLGRSFEELAALREAVARRCDAPVGFCIDTAHSFEAGYDISSEQGLETTAGLIREHLGMDSIHVLHANDSKTPLGSNRDRHESIGDGHIGSAAFARMLAHSEFGSKPFILETPFIDGGHGENVRRLWALAGTAPSRPEGVRK